MTTATEEQGPGVAQRQPLSDALRARLSGCLMRPMIVSIWFCLTIVAVVAEPFHTNDVLPLVPRLCYWAGVILVSVLVGNASDVIAAHLVSNGNAVHVSALAIALMTALFSPMVWLWGRLFSLEYPMLYAPLTDITFYVFVATSAVFVLLAAIRPHLIPRDIDIAAPMIAAPYPDLVRPRLCERLQDKDACILRLSARDHHTEVVTKTGTERIRMRFADAVNEAEPMPGTCVHRSHWVALWSVDRLERRKDKLFVVLCNGDRLPVSRTYRPKLEEAMPSLF